MKNTLEINLTHRGVRLGTAVAGPRNVFPSAAAARDATSEDQVTLVFLPFEPGPGYFGIRSICERAWRSLSNFGFLGPVADPASDAAGRAADAAARNLWAEIELHDSLGRRIPGQVVVLYDQGQPNESTHWLDVTIDRNAAGVAAVLSPPPVGASALESPPSAER